MKTKISVLALAAAGVLLANGLGATTLMHMSTGEMAAEADTIVIGTCISARSQRAGNALVTVVEISIDESLKGGASSIVRIVIPGGIDASRPVPVAVTVPGAPSVFQDEDVLVFLNRSALVAGAYDVVGFSQGIYQVVEDVFGNRVAAQGRFNGANGYSLDEMKAEIQQAVGQ